MAIKVLASDATYSTSNGSWLTSEAEAMTYRPLSADDMGTSRYSSPFTVTTGVNLTGIFCYLRLYKATTGVTFQILLEEEIASVWTEVATTPEYTATDIGKTLLTDYFEFDTFSVGTTNNYRIKWTASTTSNIYVMRSSVTAGYQYALMSDGDTTRPSDSSVDTMCLCAKLTLDQSYPESGTMTTIWTTTAGQRAGMYISDSGELHVDNSIGSNITLSLAETCIFMGLNSKINIGTEANPMSKSNQFRLETSYTSVDGYMLYYNTQYLPTTPREVRYGELNLYGEYSDDSYPLRVAIDYTSKTNTLDTEEDIPTEWQVGDTLRISGELISTTGYLSTLYTIDSIGTKNITITSDTGYPVPAGAHIVNITLATDVGIFIGNDTATSGYTQSFIYLMVYLYDLNFTGIHFYYTMIGQDATSRKSGSVIRNIYSEVGTKMITSNINGSEGSLVKNIILYGRSSYYNGRFLGKDSSVFENISCINAGYLSFFVASTSRAVLTNCAGKGNRTVSVAGSDITIDRLTISYSYIALSTCSSKWFDLKMIYNSYSAYAILLLSSSPKNTFFYNCDFSYTWANQNPFFVGLLQNAISQLIFIDCLFDTETDLFYEPIQDGISTETFLQIQNYNEDINNNSTFKAAGYFLSSTSNTILEGYNYEERDYPLYNRIKLTTGNISNASIRISVYAKITSALYYSGLNTLPYIKSDYSGGTDTTSLSENTTRQNIGVSFSPTENKVDIDLILGQNTDATEENSMVEWDTLKVTARQYGYLETNKTHILYAPFTESIDRLDMSIVNSYVDETDEAVVAVYTGISVDGTTNVITLTEYHTLQEIYDYIEYWTAQAINLQYDAPITALDNNNFTLGSSWKIISGEYITFGSQRLSGGIITFGTTGIQSPVLGVITIDFTTAGTYAMGGASFNGQITLTNSSGGNVTVELLSGVSYINTGPSITVDQPVAYQGIEFTELIAGDQVYIFDAGTQTVVDYVESSATSFSWSEIYSADRTIDYTIINEGYFPIRVTGIELTDSVLPVIVQQKVDRPYSPSSGLTFGTNATANTNTKIFGLTVDSTVQNWYSFMIESWRDESTLKNVQFPLTQNGPNSFTLKEWEFDGATSIAHLSRDGLRYVDASNVGTASWIGLLSAGDITGLQVRYQQEDGVDTTDATNTGNIDELVQIYGDSTHGNFDYTDYMVVKIQEDGYDQAEVDVVDTYGTLDDQLYVIGLAPLENGLTTGDPLVTGVTITDHGTSPVTWNGEDFSITITDSATPHSGTEIMRWLRYSYGVGGTFQSKDTFDWHDLVQTNGTKFKTVNGAIYGDTGADIKGVRVVQNDGTTPHPSFNLFTADDGSTYEPPTVITIGNTNLADGTRVRLYNVTQSTELDNSLVSGGSGYSYNATVGTGEEVVVGDTIKMTSAYNSTTTYYNETEESAVASTSDMTMLAEQSNNTVLNGYGLDGSAQTDFAADYPNVEVDINSGDTTREKLLCWLAYIITTEDGIRDFFGAITHQDSGNAIINTSVVDLLLDYTGTGNSQFTDTIWLKRDDDSTIFGGNGDNFYANSDKVYTSVVNTTGTPVITGDIADLNDVTADEVADEVMTRDVATETNATSNKGEVIKNVKKFS